MAYAKKGQHVHHGLGGVTSRDIFKKQRELVTKTSLRDAKTNIDYFLVDLVVWTCVQKL
jgi:hypothetical protein